MALSPLARRAACLIQARLRMPAVVSEVHREDRACRRCGAPLLVKCPHCRVAAIGYPVPPQCPECGKPYKPPR